MNALYAAMIPNLFRLAIEEHGYTQAPQYFPRESLARFPTPYSQPNNKHAWAMLWHNKGIGVFGDDKTGLIEVRAARSVDMSAAQKSTYANVAKSIARRTGLLLPRGT